MAISQNPRLKTSNEIANLNFTKSYSCHAHQFFQLSTYLLVDSVTIMILLPSLVGIKEIFIYGISKVLIQTWKRNYKKNKSLKVSGSPVFSGFLSSVLMISLSCLLSSTFPILEPQPSTKNDLPSSRRSDVDDTFEKILFNSDEVKIEISILLRWPH